MSKRVRAWCFTIVINYEDKAWDIPEVLPPRAKYLICQHEEGEENQTEHIQGYVYFQEAITLKNVKRRLKCAWVHLEPARGTPEQNKEYCSKEKTRIAGPWELGQIPSQGKRSDLLEMKADIDAGMSMQEVQNAYFGNWLRYENSIQKYITQKKGRRNWMTEVVIYWGPTGTGKSKRAWHEARAEFGEEEVHEGPIGKWWQGYTGQAAVILDDWYPEEQDGKLGTWLKLFDRYPIQVELKGLSCQFLAKKVWITTNQDPNQFWDGQPQDKRDAWFRRIVKMEEMKEGVWSPSEN